MTSYNFVLVNKPTMTTRYLTPLIFNKDAVATLRVYGLVNVYLDDYGASKRYKDCMFFLFQTSRDAEYDSFEKKIADFNSFYDYYEVENIQQPEFPMRMYVFKVHKVYLRDLFSFKHGRFDELTRAFLDISDPELDISTLKIDITEEIYRFKLKLETIKEDF